MELVVLEEELPTTDESTVDCVNPLFSLDFAYQVNPNHFLGLLNEPWLSV